MKFAILLDEICAAGGNPYFDHKLLQLALLAHLVHACRLLDRIHLHIKSDTQRHTHRDRKRKHLCELERITKQNGQLLEGGVSQKV